MSYTRRVPSPQTSRSEMSHDLEVPVGDLIGSPGKERPFKGTSPVRLDFGDSRVEGPMNVTGRVIGLIDAVEAEFVVTATGHFTCTRCLIEWDDAVTVETKQYFRKIPDEDGYAIVGDEVDVSGPAQRRVGIGAAGETLVQAGLSGTLPNLWNRLE